MCYTASPADVTASHEEVGSASQPSFATLSSLVHEFLYLQSLSFTDFNCPELTEGKLRPDRHRCASMRPLELLVVDINGTPKT